MALLLSGIAVGLSIMLVAFLGWAVCRTAGEADKGEEQAWRCERENILRFPRNMPPDG